MHIWQILDGKPGHENQTRGLSAALQRLSPNEEFTTDKIIATKKLNSFYQWAFRLFPQGKFLHKPQLIIGAGHRTHPAILAAQRRYGGKSIVLMQPSLPTSLFDLCIIPEHDTPKVNDNVLLTKGVLNTIQAQSKKTTNRTLILIGGPADHVSWSDEQILDQIKQITAITGKSFTISTSRRTPTSFTQALKTGVQPNVEIYLAEETPPDWLAGQLGQCSEAWVSADSVSMVYEAITAGVAVGILELKAEKNSRVIRGLTQLKKDNIVTPFSIWQRNKCLQSPQVFFNEAERCARWIFDHYFNKKIP